MNSKNMNSKKNDVKKHKNDALKKWSKIEEDISEIISTAFRFCGYCQIHYYSDIVGQFDCGKCEMSWRGICWRGDSKRNKMRKLREHLDKAHSIAINIMDNIVMDIDMGTKKPKPKKRKK